MYMQQNQLMRNWSKKVKDKLKQSANRFTKGKKVLAITYGKTTPITRAGARSEYKLQRSLTHRVYYSHGISEGAGFRIQRHGVFVHYGVGRGYKREGGVVRRVAKSKPSGPLRKPEDWFNPVINQNAPELANEIARINADASINFGHMRII